MSAIKCSNCAGPARTGGICSRCGAPQRRSVLPAIVVAGSLLIVGALFVIAYRGQGKPTLGQTPIGISPESGEP